LSERIQNEIQDVKYSIAKENSELRRELKENRVENEKLIERFERENQKLSKELNERLESEPYRLQENLKQVQDNTDKEFSGVKDRFGSFINQVAEQIVQVTDHTEEIAKELTHEFDQKLDEMTCSTVVNKERSDESSLSSKVILNLFNRA
jgi:ElaB/YqjD/DUF883 family membrane-anchored ribosome-binding protein